MNINTEVALYAMLGAAACAVFAWDQLRIYPRKARRILSMRERRLVLRSGQLRDAGRIFQSQVVRRIG